MKVKIKKEFLDKYTNDLHKVGDTIEVSEHRLMEIQSVSPDLVEVIKETKEKKTTKTKKGE